jgi:hypothetical protein
MPIQLNNKSSSYLIHDAAHAGIISFLPQFHNSLEQFSCLPNVDSPCLSFTKTTNNPVSPDRVTSTNSGKKQ